MNKIVFQIMGGFVLWFAMGLLVVDILWIGHYSLHLPREVTTLGIVWSVTLEVAFTLLGLGLIYRRKWAALVLSLLTLYWAFLAFEQALRPSSIPGEWTWVGYCFGILLFIPTIMTARYWRVLVWRRLSGTDSEA
jgi:hypothetical protein